MATLSYLDSQGRWQNLELEHETTTIGRLLGQDLVLPDPQVSRQHAVVLRKGLEYWIVDQGSRRGTFLNGNKVLESPLREGDVLQFGAANGILVRFHARSSDTRKNSQDQTSFLDLLAAPATVPTGSARQMEQLNWLLTAARQLNEVGAIEDILRVLLQLTLQLTGVERGFVFLAKDGAMRCAQGLGANGAQLTEDDTISHRAMRASIESGKKFLVGDTLDDAAISDWSSVVQKQIRSVYCIPLRKQGAQAGELLGLLYLDSRLTAGSLSAVDHELLDTISTRAAALVHNALLAEEERKARVFRDELALAARIHSGLMANELPTPRFAELAGKSVPCLSIGGDFYDAVELEDCVCVTIMDVSGKGISAAIVAATLQGIIHAELLAGHGLADIATLVNRFLCSRNIGKYATLVMARLFADGRLEYLNCGHVRPVIVSAGEVRTLPESNLVVGLLAHAQYSQVWDQLHPGDRLLLVTDGLTEAEDASGEAFGDARFEERIRNGSLDELLQAVAAFHAPAEAQDDCTALELRYRP